MKGDKVLRREPHFGFREINYHLNRESILLHQEAGGFGGVEEFLKEMTGV